MGVLQETVVGHGPTLTVVKGPEHRAVGQGLEDHMQGRAVEPALSGRVVYFDQYFIREVVGGTSRVIAEIMGEVVGKPHEISELLSMLSPPEKHEDARRRRLSAQDRDALRKPSGPAQ